MKTNFKELPCFQKIHFNVNGPIHAGNRNPTFDGTNSNPLKCQISGEQSRQSTMAQTALSSLEPNPEASRNSSSSFFPQEPFTKAATMHGRKIGAMNQVEIVSRSQNSMHNKAFGQIASLSAQNKYFNIDLERTLIEPCKSIEITPSAEGNGSLGSSSEITYLKKIYPDEKQNIKDINAAKIENGILRRTKRFAQSVHDPLSVVIEVERKSSEKNLQIGRSESSTPQKDKFSNNRSESRKKNGDRGDIMVQDNNNNLIQQQLFAADPSKKTTTIKLKKKQTGLTNRKPKTTVIKSPEIQKLRSLSRGKKRSETTTQGNKTTNDKLRDKITASPEKQIKLDNNNNNLQEFKKKKKKMSTHSSKQFSQIQKIENDLNINQKVKLNHVRSISNLIGHQQSISVQQQTSTTKKDGNDFKQDNDERLNQQEGKQRVNYDSLKKESSAKLISMKRKSQHSCLDENNTEMRVKQGESGEQENSEIQNRKRREEIGVAFLNNLNESFIRNRIEWQKTKKEMLLPSGDDPLAQKKIVSPNSEEVKKFMILKKKRIEIEIKKKLEDQKERQERLKNNLQLLDQEIKQCRQTVVLHPGPQSLQRSKSVIQRKQQGRTRSIPNLHSLHSQSLVSGNYKFTSIADSENAGKEEGPITNNYFIHSLQQQQMLNKQTGNSKIKEEDISNGMQFQNENFDEISNEYKKLFYSKQLYSEDKPISQNILLSGPQSACVTPKNFGKKMKKQKKEVSLSKQKSLSLHSSNSMEIIKPITNVRSKQTPIETNKPQQDDQSPQFQNKDNIQLSSNGFEKLPPNQANIIQSLQNTPQVSAMDSLYKKFSAQNAFLASADVSAAAELVSKDKFLFDLIHSKKEELKERYAQMSNRMTKMKEAEIKEQSSENMQVQTYYQQKPNLLPKQQLNQISNSVPASSQRKSHTSKSSLIKEEPEEDDTHHNNNNNFKEQKPIQNPRDSMSNLRNDLKELFSNKIKAIKAGEIQLSKENGIVKTQNKTDRDKTEKLQSNLTEKNEIEKQNETNLSQLSLKPFPAVSQIDEPLSETQLKIIPPQTGILSPQQLASAEQSEEVIVRNNEQPNLDNFQQLNDVESQIVSDSQAQKLKQLAQQNVEQQQNNQINYQPVDPNLPVSLEQQETVQSHVYLDEQTNEQKSYFQEQNIQQNNSNHDSNDEEFEHAYTVAVKEGAEMNNNDEVEFLYELNFEQLEELKAMLLNSDPNQPEVQTLFEQLSLYNEAAVLIQKNIRGCLTRKYIYAILEYQQQEEEKENQIFMQAEKFLEESQIDPEELLEGNPMPFRSQNQRDLYYHHHQSDHFHETDEQHEMLGQQSINNSKDQQRINVDYPKENYQQPVNVNFLNEKQLIQTLEASQQKISPIHKQENIVIQQNKNEVKQPQDDGIKAVDVTVQVNQDEKINLNSSLQMKNNIAILKEEQAKKWNDMMTQLQLLQQDGSSNLSEKTKAFLDRLQKQSEFNKQVLIDGDDRQTVNINLEEKINGKGNEQEKGNVNQENNNIADNTLVHGQQPIEGQDQNTQSSEDGINFARKSCNLEISHRGNLEINEIPNEDQKEICQSQHSHKQGDNSDLEQTPQRILRDQKKQSTDEQEHAAITKALQLTDSTKLRGKLSPLYDEEIVNTSSSQNDSASIINSSSLLFQQQPFKEFTKNIIKKLAIPHKQVDQLLKERENAIEGKHQSQINLIEKMQQKQKLSPKSFERKRFQLEKWATKEKEELKTVKSQIEKGWEQFALTIQRTKRDLEFIEQTKKVDTSKLIQSTEEDQLRKLLSLRTETDNSLEDFEKRYPETVRSVELATANIKVIDAYQPLELIINSKNNQLSNDSQIYQQSSCHSKQSLPSTPPLGPNSPKDAMTDIFGHNFSSYNPRHLTLSQEINLKVEDSQKQSDKEMIVKITENLSNSQPSEIIKKKNEIEETNRLDSDKQNNEELQKSSHSSKGEINGTQEQDNKILKHHLTVDQRRSRMIADIALPMSVQTPDKTAEESTFKTPDPSLFATQQDTSSVKWGESSDSSQVLELLAETSPRGLINSLESFKADFKKQPDNEEKEKLSPFSPIMPIFGRKGISQPHSRKTLDFNGKVVEEPADKSEKNEELKPLNEIKVKDKQDDSISKKRIEDNKEKVETIAVISNNQEPQEQNIPSQSLNNGPGLECSTLNFVKDYLVAFSEFVKDNFRDDFLERVNVPLGMDPQEFLKTFTITETLDSSDGEITAAPIYPIVKFIHMQSEVISEELFGLFNDIFNRERDLNGMTEDLFIMESYHMKLVYDCFNEALDSMRPFGLRGKPLPWKINSNKLSSITITPENIEKILGLAIAKVLKWGSFLCGFIPERIESPTGEIIQIDNEYLNQIKEDRLAQMLENDVIENEDKWLIYEDEETDVQLEISDEVFNFLVEETAMLLYELETNNEQNENVSSQDKAAEEDQHQKFEEDSLNAEDMIVESLFSNTILKEGKKTNVCIRPTMDLGLAAAVEEEEKKLKRELFVKNLKSGFALNPQSNHGVAAALANKDALNSSF